MEYYQNIILIEDDQDDQEFFLAAIHDIDARIVCTVYEREDFTSKMLESTPDLVVFAISRITIQYNELVESWIQAAINWKIPFVIMSTVSLDKQLFSRSGAKAIINKPTSFVDLKKWLRHILERKSGN